jgi:hypothetical protein
MLGDLPQDIIGTNPTYPSVVNHDWLTPDPASYDNYPSDNNSVRVLPKLADLWGTKESTGINLVPNTGAQPLACYAKEEKKDTEVVDEVVRDAKQAMMLGYKGKNFVDHLRSRHSSDSILKAKEALGKLSSEQGLLGNVYIDASAFSSAREAEEFLKLHRTRLAREIVVNASKVNGDVISLLASKFRKNVVASVTYNEDLFAQYKTHLVEAGRISKDFIIDSKESLRQAFLHVKIKEATTKVAKGPVKISAEVANKELNLKGEKLANIDKLVKEELGFKTVRPIITFAREQLAKGKSRSDLKEMLGKKYAVEDLKQSAKYLAMVISTDGLIPENVDKLVTANEIPDSIGEELKKLGKKNPIKEEEEVKEKSARSIGQQGYFYNLTGKPVTSEHQASALESLRKGDSIRNVAQMLASKLPIDQAKNVLASALTAFNASPIGVKANAPVKVEKEKAPELKKKETLPDPKTIEAKSQEILSFFEGSNSGDIDIDLSPVVEGNLDIGDLNHRSGLDVTISG